MNFRRFKSTLDFHFKIKWKKADSNNYYGYYRDLIIDYYAYKDFPPEWLLTDYYGEELLGGQTDYSAIRTLIRFLKRHR